MMHFNMRYYQLGRLMLFFWLPGCHGNHRRPQNVPKVSPKETKMFFKVLLLCVPYWFRYLYL